MRVLRVKISQMHVSFQLASRQLAVHISSSCLISDYTCVSTIHHKRSNPAAISLSEDDPERYTAGLPVVSFHFSEEFRQRYPKVQQASVSTLLRTKGWILPNYPLPPNEENQEILRVVVRESFSSSILLCRQ
jgi:glutamate decarboxylase